MYIRDIIEFNRAIWIRDFNVVFFQRVPDDKKNIRRAFVFPVINPIDQKFDVKVDATLGEAA